VPDVERQGIILIRPHSLKKRPHGHLRQAGRLTWPTGVELWRRRGRSLPPWEAAMAAVRACGNLADMGAADVGAAEVDVANMGATDMDVTSTAPRPEGGRRGVDDVDVADADMDETCRVPAARETSGKKTWSTDVGPRRRPRELGNGQTRCRGSRGAPRGRLRTWSRSRFRAGPIGRRIVGRDARRGAPDTSSSRPAGETPGEAPACLEKRPVKHWEKRCSSGRLLLAHRVEDL
jgi:hypothetical protein